MDNREYYFAYGANLLQSGMRKRCPDSTACCRAVLPGYRLAFDRVATIIPEPGASVYGALYRISRYDLLALDRFEGYPHLYTRFPVEVVKTGNKHRVTALVYQLREARSFTTPPDPYYLATILQGISDWGLSDDWARQVQDIARHSFRSHTLERRPS